MISKWTVENFKSAYDKVPLEFAPLTIFAGANSSGKSTLIQSILLTAQTLQSPVYSKCVVLNGNIVRLGTFADVLSNGSAKREIGIGFELTHTLDSDDESSRLYRRYYFDPEFLNALNSISCSFSFSAEGPSDKRDTLQLQPTLERSELSFVPKLKEVPGARISLTRQTRSVMQIATDHFLSEKEAARTDLSSLEYQVYLTPGLDAERRFYRRPYGAVAVGANTSHFLPGRLSVVYDANEDRAFRILESITDPSQSRYSAPSADDDTYFRTNARLRNELSTIVADITKDIPASPLSRQRIERAHKALLEDFSRDAYQQFYGSLLPQNRKQLQLLFSQHQDQLLDALRGDLNRDYRLAPTPLPEAIGYCVGYVHTFFSERVRYLGPLRDEPKPVYPLAGSTDPTDVGFRGEHTAAVLDSHKTTLIRYLPSAFVSNNATPVGTASLADAVLDWLSYMGIGEHVETIDKGKLGHELKIGTGSDTALHDLTHVGVGVSQVLPILVLSLLAEPGSTLIFEQPELHLHPRVQTRLADFFASLMLVRKQCIVETHSEYLVSRLRYLSALFPKNAIANNVKLYFVEKDRRASSYRLVEINEFGVIKDWPKGFFDENDNNAASLLEAAMRKRSLAREQ